MASRRNHVDAADATGDDDVSIPLAAEVERQHGDDAAADESQMRDGTPVLVFQVKKEEMHMLSVVVSDDDQQLLLRKNVEHYAHLRKLENLFLRTPEGWMLIMEYPQDKPDTSSTAAYLWNPRTGDKLPLPNIQEQHDTVLGSDCLLTHRDPSHPGCVVVLLLRKDGMVPHMWFCRISGGRWRCFPYEIPSFLGVPFFRRFILVVTACRGKLYFINTSDSMGVIHFPSNEGDELQDPVFQYFDVPRINNVLPNGTSSGGRSWVHDIGDAVVFLDGGYSRIAASCAASPLGLKGSHIYLFDYRKNGDDASYYLCTFDLGLDTLEDIWVPPKSIIDALRGRQPFWIVPPTPT
ncbi:unnamed protein product [Urochloa humidicola]